MADKILPQRVSASHRSPQQTPTPCCPISFVSPPPKEQSFSGHSHFYFWFKKLIKK